MHCKSRYRWMLQGGCAVTMLLIVACYAGRSNRSEQLQGEQQPRPRATTRVEGAAPATPPVRMGGDAVALHVALGIGDKQPTAWNGTVSLSAGKVESIDLWRPGPKWRVEGDHFATRTRRQGGQNGRLIRPELFVTVDAPGGDAVVSVNTNHGSARFALHEVTSGKTLELLDGRASVRRVPASTKITPAGPDDDFPAAALAPDGKVWLVYVSYQSGTPLDLEAIGRDDFDSMVTQNNGDRVLLSAYDGTEWSAAQEVTEGLNDVWRPTVAVDGQGNVWVAWSQNVDGNWDIYRRKWDPGQGRWSAIERMTRDAGADINVVSARDAGGNVWFAWQAWRDGNFDILLTSTERAIGDALVVAETEENEWDPAIAADAAGNVYVGWDSYGSGNYDVFVRSYNKSHEGKTAVAVANTPRYEARVSLACDKRDRLWIAYEEGDVNWGKDYANGTPGKIPIENLGNSLYGKRTVRVKCLAGGQLLEPASDVSHAFGESLNRNKSFPRLGVDGRGNPWLLFRHHPLPGGGSENWSSYATYYDGSRWQPAEFLPTSDFLLDNRAALVAGPNGGLLAVYTSDGRLRGGGPNLGSTRFAPAEGDRDTELYASVLTAGSEGGDAQLVPDEPEEVDYPLVHPHEKEAISRMRAYRIEQAGTTYQLLRGEFHRHTEFTAHRDQDGGLEEMWRYALDAAGMDWLGNGDHDNGWGREYPWWIIQKTTDIFYEKPNFVPPFTYERSNIYPNGHRNVMFARRGIRTLARTELLGTPEDGTPDTKHLYAYLRHFGGICASHTSGTNMGTDWRDNDPELEPVVEIYQGHRHNYEHFGAPRSPTQSTNIGGYQPAGFVWNALAKGYRLGFESSSDHVSTHMSYAVVLAEEPSRQGIVDAFRKRHSYAATDNIILDFRSGEHLMGDEFTQAANDPIALDVKVIGTRSIARIDVVKNNGYMYVQRPGKAESEFTWKELGGANVRRGTVNYYYVRVEQEDGQLAWSSPIWVRYE